MDKKSLAYICIIALALCGMAVFLGNYINPENGNFQGRIIPFQPTGVFTSADHDPRYVPENNLIAGICALFLVGYLFYVVYLKFKKESQADMFEREGSLYNISLTTGRTEYELFCKSAEGWSVSGDRIDADFGRYMVDQVLPYYARDFVRKNHEHIDASLIKKEEVEPTSLWDWVKALLIVPGSLLLLLAMVFFCK